MADSELEQLAKSDRNPVQEGRYKELLAQSNLGYFQGGNESNTTQFRAFAGGGGGLSGGATTDPIAQAQKLLAFQQQANQPQIASLQAQLPEIEQKYGAESARLTGEKEPLKQRYQNIIDQLTGREKADIGMAQQRTSREFGYRGIPASSTLFLDELQRAESPIRQQYGGQIKEVGLEQETGLRGIDQLLSQLAGQSVESKRVVQNAIAQLQSGNPGDAIQGAMQILQLQEQQRQFGQQQTLAQQQQGLREREFGLQEQVANRPQEQDRYATIGEGQSLFDLQSLQQIFKNPKTYKAGGADNDPY